MTNQLFNFNNNQVSVIINENNEPLFIAKDICNVLGTTNVSQALLRLDDDEKSYIISNDVNVGTPKLSVITESGLYSLVLSSKKPEAKAFKKWVTSEVLPSIRKNGMYATAPTLDEMLANPEFAIKTFEALQKEREAKQLLATQNEQLQVANELQTKQMQANAPKVEYYEVVLQSNSTYTTNQIAKELGYSAISLNQILHKKGVQYKQSDTWLLYSKYQNCGYTKTKTYSFTDDKGNPKTAMQTVWSEKGRKFIHDLLTQN